jgi:hypothetical protein
MRTFSLVLAIGLAGAVLVDATVCPARTWLVPAEAPTIQAGIDSAVAGDVVEVSCGTYEEHDILMKGGIELRSSTGLPDCVAIDAQENSRVMFCNQLDNRATLRGLTLRGGRVVGEDGGGLYCQQSQVAVYDCDFRKNESILQFEQGGSGGGVYCWDSSVEFYRCRIENNSAQNSGGAGCWGGNVRLEDCIIRDNTADSSSGGVTLGWQTGYSLDRCLFARNSGGAVGGLDVYYATGEVTGCVFYDQEVETSHPLSSIGATFSGTHETDLVNCTFAHNTRRPGEGAVVVSLTGIIRIHNTLMAFNKGRTFYTTGCVVEFHNCNFFGNTGGDWPPDMAYWLTVYGNYCADPCFCNGLAGDLTLCADSCCLPENHPWGLGEHVGALGAGCDPCGCPGPIQLEAKSWGAVKRMYR